MTKFADHLYETLMDEHGDALTAVPAAAAAAAASAVPARRRVTRPVWASAGTLAAAAAAALGFTVFGGTASAYAVTDNHDGTLTIKVDNASGISGANTALHKLGSRVAVVAANPSCPSIDTFRAADHGTGETKVDVQLKGGDPNSITVGASGVPADETALVVYSFDHGKSAAAMVPIKGQVPTCVSLPTAPPPGSVITDGSGLTNQTGGPDNAPGLKEQSK